MAAGYTRWRLIKQQVQYYWDTRNIVLMTGVPCDGRFFFVLGGQPTCVSGPGICVSFLLYLCQIHTLSVRPCWVCMTIGLQENFYDIVQHICVYVCLVGHILRHPNGRFMAGEQKNLVTWLPTSKWNVWLQAWALKNNLTNRDLNYRNKYLGYFLCFC